MLFKINKYFNKFIDNLLKSENRRKNLIIIAFLIVCNMLALTFYVSYAYYYDELNIPILRTKVGNFKISEYDYVLEVYIENIGLNKEGIGKYHLTNEIPINGYVYSGYNCLNNSLLIYDDIKKITTVTTNQKELCEIYFDIESNVDIGINILVEDDIDSYEYKIVKEIPFFGYRYSNYECINNSEIIYNSELHNITMSSLNNDVCNIYFEKVSDNKKVNLYVAEDTEYLLMDNIPQNKNYYLDKTKSFCINKNNERLNTDITYDNGYVVINDSEADVCNIYLNNNND